jgi:hypothetical protein
MLNISMATRKFAGSTFPTSRGAIVSVNDAYWPQGEVLGSSSEPASQRPVLLTRFPGVVPHWLMAIVASGLQEVRSSIDAFLSGDLVSSFLGGDAADRRFSGEGDIFDEADDELADPCGVQMVTQKTD